MIRYFAFSCGVHAGLGALLLLALQPAVTETKTTYTIDFIGSGKVVAMQPKQETPPAKEEVKKEIAQETQKPAEETKPNKKAYDSKAEISAQKQPKKKEAPAPLAAPSILDEIDEEPSQTQPETTSSDGDFEGGNIETDFATFPYPWYITQVRNSLWSEWEKRRPAGVSLKAMISFAIARDGKIKNLKAAKSSGDDSFDFAAKSAVINAGPFPPLPMLYEKDELTVTVEFKQEK